jgi:hypothetical protein
MRKFWAVAISSRGGPRKGKPPPKEAVSAFYR